MGGGCWPPTSLLLRALRAFVVSPSSPQPPPLLRPSSPRANGIPQGGTRPPQAPRDLSDPSDPTDPATVRRTLSPTICLLPSVLHPQRDTCDTLTLNTSPLSHHPAASTFGPTPVKAAHRQATIPLSKHSSPFAVPSPTGTRQKPHRLVRQTRICKHPTRIHLTSSRRHPRRDPAGPLASRLGPVSQGTLPKCRQQTRNRLDCDRTFTQHLKQPQSILIHS